MRVYVSSTFSDLSEHRIAVKRVIESLQDTSFEQYQQPSQSCFEYVGLEYLSADAEPSLKTRLEEVARSDIFVLLLGWRYGYVPEDNEKSITELEYETAIHHKLPVLSYVIDEGYPVAVKFIDTGEIAEKLRRFKERLRKEGIVKLFTSPDDLAQKITADLSFSYQRVMHTPMREVAKDMIAMPQVKDQLERCKQDNVVYVATINSFRKKLQNIVPSEPIWTRRNFTIDGTLAFVLMPLRENFLCVYQDAILPAVNNAGLRGSHPGEIFDNREIVEDIWESICTARLIIADVTGRNPNVFYELGICHTLGKEVVVVTQSAEDVPFDIRHRRFIEYKEDRLASLRTRLEKTIKQVLMRTQSRDIGA